MEDQSTEVLSDISITHSGTGSLTDQLLAVSKKVIAIEADPRLQRYLAKKYHLVRPIDEP